MKISFNWNKKKSKPFGFFTEECLSKREADKLISLTDLDTLINMGKNERFTFFSGVLGKEKSEWFNGRFEDFLFKNQQEVMLRWAKETEMRPEIKKSILNQIFNLKKILNPKEKEEFYKDLVAQKLGLRTTFDQATQISKLCSIANEAKKKMEDGGDGTDYEKATETLNAYMNKLKADAEYYASRE